MCNVYYIQKFSIFISFQKKNNHSLLSNLIWILKILKIHVLLSSSRRWWNSRRAVNPVHQRGGRATPDERNHRRSSAGLVKRRKRRARPSRRWFATSLSQFCDVPRGRPRMRGDRREQGVVGMIQCGLDAPWRLSKSLPAPLVVYLTLDHGTPRVVCT